MGTASIQIVGTLRGTRECVGGFRKGVRGAHRPALSDGKAITEPWPDKRQIALMNSGVRSTRLRRRNEKNGLRGHFSWSFVCLLATPQPVVLGHPTPFKCKTPRWINTRVGFPPPKNRFARETFSLNSSHGASDPRKSLGCFSFSPTSAPVSDFQGVSPLTGWGKLSAVQNNKPRCRMLRSVKQVLRRKCE